MGYSTDDATDIGRQLLVMYDGRDVWMGFEFLKEERLVSSDDQSETDISETLREFARGVADALKEERGRYGTVLPWDPPRP